MRWQQAKEQVWQGLNSRALLLALLSGLLSVLGLALLLPQTPVAPADTAAFTRWLVETRPLLGQWEKPLEALGWLSLHYSLWMRVPLALLALTMMVRWQSLLEDWRVLTRRERVARLLVGIGGLVLLAGWGAQMAWGWVEPSVIIWPAEPVQVPERGLTLGVQPGAHGWFTERYGIYLLPERPATGVGVQVLDEQGQGLPLLPSTRSAPQQQLRFALTLQTLEAYFAVPAAGLVFRLERSALAADQLTVQGFRSATGQVVKTTALQGDAVVPLDSVRLLVTHLPVRQVRVVYNPGAVPQAVGLLFLALGALWPVGRTAPGLSSQEDQTGGSEVSVSRKEVEPCAL